MKEFVKFQNKSNKQLIALDSSADQPHSALLKVLASNNMLVEEQGWNTFNDINENVASLLTSWEAIYSIYNSLKQNRQNIKKGAYESSIDAMDIFFSKELNNRILFVEGFKQQWIQASQGIKDVKSIISFLNHSIDPIQDPKQKAIVIQNKEKAIATNFWNLEYYFEALIKCHPEKLTVTNKFINYFNKRRFNK
ncbi:MAG: hypothetical protein ABI261_08090 [Ginsengibacter sp.]